MDTLKIKNSEIRNEIIKFVNPPSQHVQEPLNVMKGEKHVYFVHYNIQKLEAAYKAFNDTRNEFAEKFNKLVSKEYKDSEEAIREEFSMKGKDGESIYQNGVLQMDNSKGEEISAAMEELKIKLPKDKKEIDKIEKEFDEFLSSEVEIKIRKIKISDLSSDITPVHTLVIQDYIIEE